MLAQTCQRNNGGCQHTCMETATGVSCTCRSGYRLIDDHLCRGEILISYTAKHVNALIIVADINECLISNGGCSHSCINGIGSYYCGCPTGYVLQPNNRDCLKSE